MVIQNVVTQNVVTQNVVTTERLNEALLGTWYTCDVAHPVLCIVFQWCVVTLW